MYAQQIAVLALAVAPLVAGHGYVAQVVGDQGGNGTGIGVKGASVAGFGPNSATEKDTTVFNSQNIRTDGDFGKTTSSGQLKNNLANNFAAAMDMSGSTLPQVSAGGYANTSWLVITSDGCGPVEAIVDESGTGAFSTAKSADVTSSMPGTKGNCPKSLASGKDSKAEIGPKASMTLAKRLLVKMGLIKKRAVNDNVMFPVLVSMPSDLNCQGNIGGQSNVCLIKLSNNNKAGPFGGIAAIQQVSSNTTATTATTAKTAKTAKRAQVFES